MSRPRTAERMIMPIVLTTLATLQLTCPTTPFSNIPAIIEKQVEIVTHMAEGDLASVEADADAEAGWHQQAMDVAQMTVVPLGDKVNSWLTGANVPGKPVGLLFYMGGYKVYSDLWAGHAAAGFRGLQNPVDVTQSIIGV